MSIQDFLEDARGELEGEEGSFTLHAERARRLLSQHALPDVWLSWLCLIQGFHRLGARALDVRVDKGRVLVGVDLPSCGMDALVADERLLLGWLNLSFFGEVKWRWPVFEVVFSGSMFRRYKLFLSLKSYLSKHLAMASSLVKLNGTEISRSSLPGADHYAFYQTDGSAREALVFPESSEVVVRSKFFALHGTALEQWPSDDCFAAVAYKSKVSWSQVSWFHHGVLIKQERNTLERPGLAVLACVEPLGLTTDLSGFQVVHDEAYFAFVNRLKKDVLWML